MKLVLVTWEDASEEGGVWIDMQAAEPLEVVVFEQVGWLMSHTATEVVLSCTLQEGRKGLMSRRTRIPTGMVRSIVELTPGNPVSRTRKPRKDTHAQGQ